MCVCRAYLLAPAPHCSPLLARQRGGQLRVEAPLLLAFATASHAHTHMHTPHALYVHFSGAVSGFDPQMAKAAAAAAAAAVAAGLGAEVAAAAGQAASMATLRKRSIALSA